VTDTKKATTRSGIQGSLTGKAGEHAVCAQLLLREVSVLWPSVDTGVDLFTDKGCRIQVKTAHMCSTEKAIRVHGEGAYFFPLPKTKRRAATNTTSVMVPRRKFADTCDVVVFWGIEQNRFWIVPARLCDTVQAFVLGPKNERRFSGSIESLREMEKLGYTHQQIADKYNMERSQVTTYINDESRVEVAASAVSHARICEGAWDLIVKFPGRGGAFDLPLPRLTAEQTVSSEGE
jgi:hypothetical protein